MTSKAYPGEAADPRTRECDWCGEPGVKAIELRKPGNHIYGTAQYLYPCSKHVGTAERLEASQRSPQKRKAA